MAQQRRFLKQTLQQLQMQKGEQDLMDAWKKTFKEEEEGRDLSDLRKPRYIIALTLLWHKCESWLTRIDPWKTKTMLVLSVEKLQLFSFFSIVEKLWKCCPLDSGFFLSVY